MKQKKYRLLKDIDTPSFFVKSGSIAELVDSKYYTLKGEKYQGVYNIKDVEGDPEWFEEVKEEYTTEDKRKKEIMKAYSDGIMIGVKFNFKPDIQTDPEKYFNENFNQ